MGYCQGMNFLVGLLIFYLPREDDAFGALVFLMHERGLRDLYTTNMKLLEVILSVIDHCLFECVFLGSFVAAKSINA